MTTKTLTRTPKAKKAEGIAVSNMDTVAYPSWLTCWEDDFEDTKDAPEYAFKMPEDLAQIPDLLHLVKDYKSQIEKIAKKIDGLRSKIERHVIDNLSKEVGTVAGRNYVIKLNPHETSIITDWNKFYKHVHDSEDFALMNKAHARKYVTELLQSGEKVPGAEIMNEHKLSLTKITGSKSNGKS